MDTVQEFEEWSGMKVNLKKTCMLIIDGNKGRQKVSGRVTYKGVPVRVLGEKESCRYLGFWETANGDMSETKQRVMENTKEARDQNDRSNMTLWTPRWQWNCSTAQG